jgi:hypothetical protein
VLPAAWLPGSGPCKVEATAETTPRLSVPAEVVLNLEEDANSRVEVASQSGFEYFVAGVDSPIALLSDVCDGSEADLRRPAKPKTSMSRSRRANGYPNPYLSSGISLKFMPWIEAMSVGAKRMAAHVEIRLTSSPWSIGALASRRLTGGSVVLGRGDL